MQKHELGNVEFDEARFVACNNDAKEHDEICISLAEDYMVIKLILCPVVHNNL